MLPFSIPAFEEPLYHLERENNTATVLSVENVGARLFDAYSELLLSHGFEKKEERIRTSQSYAAFAKGSLGVFLNHFGNTRELRLVTEENCRYFDFCDQSAPTFLAPSISQFPLEDFGLCYVVRLGDGRFVIFDGGCGFDPDIERLHAHLTENATGDRPVIAAWIMTHPHGDHYRAFNHFMRRFADEVELQKVLLNFPEADDLVHYPALEKNDARFDYPTAPMINVPIMFDLIEKSGAELFMLHTGQTYQIGDATFEVLSCLDDTIHASQNINAISLVLRMELGSQVTLWCTDAAMSIARIPERYGSYLKSDILQIPHHGFQSGTAEAEIAAYDLIRPDVCLLPVSEYNAFTRFCTFREGTRHLMRDLDVSELITGDSYRTLTLPYRAPSTAKAALARRFTEGLENNGARTWIFSDLSTALESDFVFTLLNTTNFDATVWIELYFDNRKRTVQNIKLTMPSMALKTINVTGNDVEHNAVFFNWMSIEQRGIPENVPFAVRFLSDRPIVVTHKSHAPAFYTKEC